MAMKQEVNAPLIITVGVVSVLLLITIAVGVEAWFRYEEQNEEAAKWQESQNTWLQDIRKEENANLTTVRWADKDKKAVTIPIDQAMKLVAENQGKAPVAAAR